MVLVCLMAAVLAALWLVSGDPESSAHSTAAFCAAGCGAGVAAAAGQMVAGDTPSALLLAAAAGACCFLGVALLLSDGDEHLAVR